MPDQEGEERLAAELAQLSESEEDLQDTSSEPPVEELPEEASGSLDELPPIPAGFGESDDLTPHAFKILFERQGRDLSKITETPPRMVLPLVRMSLIAAASDPEDGRSLIEVFMQSFDDRMISVDRKGRIEAVQIMQAAMRRADEDEELTI